MAAPRKPSKGRGRDVKPRATLLGGLVQAGLALCVMLTLLGGFFFLSMARGLPDPSMIEPAPRTGAITLLDRHGRVITHRGSGTVSLISPDALPEHLADAVLAVEDRRFYSHFGIDLIGTARAAIANMRAGHVVQGGSTITQQLAKNLFLTSERTMTRKIEELMLAFRLENHFSKDEILALYLNRVYFGAGAWGAEDAARRYFGKPAGELEIGEAALLAGLLKAPSLYSPSNDAQRAAVRATVVLDIMHATGRISHAERVAAASAPIRVSRGSASPGAGWFADWVLPETRTLARLYAPDYRGDLVVRTTLDITAQRAAEAALRTGLADADISRGATAGAVVALDASGGVTAMAGGADYARSPFNRAANARRQPGSAFKAFVYASAMEAGYSPDHVFVDAPVSYGGWTPANWEGRYEGEMSLERAFARSSNSIAVQLAETTGRGHVINLARRLGIDSPMQNTHALTLGAYEVTPLEMTAAYTAFMNGGRKVEPYGVTAIAAPDGRALYTREPVAGPKVLADRVVAQMDRLFGAVTGYGTGRAAQVEGRVVRGKTGTTNSFRDAWFTGWADGMSASVWIGHDDNRSTDQGSGGAGPARIFAEFIAAAPAYDRPRPAPEPDAIARTLADIYPELADPSAAPEASQSGGDDAIAALLSEIGQ